MKITPEIMANCTHLGGNKYAYRKTKDTKHARYVWLMNECPGCKEPFLAGRLGKPDPETGELNLSTYCSHACASTVLFDEHTRSVLFSPEVVAKNVASRKASAHIWAPKQAGTRNKAASHRVFRYYLTNAQRRGIVFAVTEDELLAVTQLNCHYCGLEPSQQSKSVAMYAPAGLYIHNGVDRLDPTRGYYLDNIVPCCEHCNVAKQQMTAAEFIAWARCVAAFNPNGNTVPSQVVGEPFNVPVIINNILANYHFMKPVYKRGLAFELTREQFETLLRSTCNYCGTPPSRKRFHRTNKNKFIWYNGIDRIDSSAGYTTDNVVTCCRQCNVAKGEMSVSEFYAWINRIVQFQDSKINASLVLP